MAYGLNPLKRLSPDISYNDFDDVYVFVPYKKKNSSEYRSFVKSLGGHFDSLSCRWFIRNNKLSDSTKNAIRDLNIYDGLKFVWRRPFPEITQNNRTIRDRLCDLQSESVTPVVCKQIKFEKNKSVQYFSLKDKDYVVEIFVDNIYKMDYHEYYPFSIRLKVLDLNILPIEYARYNWIHYMNRSMGVTDLRETGIERICDSFI